MKCDLMELLQIAADRKASDLHLSAGSGPLVRVNSDLVV